MMTEQQRRVWQMRMSGMTVRAIAAEIGRAPSSVEQCLAMAARNAWRENSARQTGPLRYEDADVSSDASLHIIIVRNAAYQVS